MTRNRRFSMLWLPASLLIAVPLWGQDSIGISCPSMANAGAAVSCSVNVALGADTVDNLTFGVTVTANGGAPALSTGHLSFADQTGNLALGAVTFNTDGTPNSLAVVYSSVSPAGDGNPEFTGSLAVANIGFTMPAGAIPGQNYAVTITGSSASNDQVTPNFVLTATGPAPNFTIGAANTVTVAALPSQTIAFNALNNVVYGVAPFTVSATSSSNLTVSFASQTTAVCTTGGTNGATVTIVGGGTCTIQATQAGSSSFSPATPVNQSFTVNPASQTITFGALSGVTYGVSPITVSATATSSLPVTFTSLTSTVCTTTGTNGSTVTIAAGGQCTIQASQGGNANYSAAANVNQSFNVATESQTINFQPIGPVTYGVSPFNVNPTATSNLAVTVASTTPLICSVASAIPGYTVTILAGGSCTLQATQTGSAQYSAATPVNVSVTVNPETQTITFGALSGVNYGVSPFPVSATSTSGQTVTFTTITTSVCTTSGTNGATVTIVGIGGCTITASAAATANGDYSAANQVMQSFTVSQATQTITFNALGNVNFGASPFAVSATSSSNLAVAFSSATTSVCTTSGATGSTVTIVGVGTCTINANQAGNTDYAAAAQVQQSFNVNQGTQTINFGSLNNVAISASPITVSATATSGLAVTFSSNTTGTCTTSGATGSTVALVATGTCTIQANQAGNTNYTAASPVTQSFTISAASQTITFGALGNVTFGVAPFNVSATASSNLAVTFSSLTTAVCTVSGNTVTVIAGGSCTIAADQAGNANFGAAPEVQRSFTVSPTTQSITFGPIAAVNLGISPFALTPTASSGLTVTLTSNSLPVCTVSGLTVTILTTGICSLTASQGGNASYTAAASVNQSFTVNATAQTITFNALSGVSYGVSPITVSATSTSNLTVSFASTTTPVCTTSGANGATVTIVGVGQCTIQATQAGNTSFAAATPVNQSFTVSQATQTITFNALSGVNFGASPFTVSATSSSNLVVTFSSGTASVCTTSGNNGATVTIVGVGTCTINANQAGNTFYAAATQVPQSFTVSQGTQTITFNQPPNVAISASPITVSATATSGLAVTFSSTTTGICTTGGTNGSSVTLVTVGTCTIQASQGGSANWTAAASVTQSFTVSAAAQTITFGALNPVTFGVAPITVSATASSTLAVTFTSLTTTVCTTGGTNGATVTIVGGGQCQIQASQAGNVNFGAATPITQSFTVNPATQTITFGAIAAVNFGISPFALTATASSGLAVTYVSNTASVCTVSAGTVTIVSQGFCSLTASQAGNASYNAATPVTQSFTVNAAAQTITFGALSGVTFGAAPFTVSATSSSNLTVSFASTTTAVCTTSGTNGTTVTIAGAGTCTIQATQAGNANFAAATPVNQSFTVTQATQTITFNALANKTFGIAPFTVSATSTSNLAVSFASTTTSVCTTSGTNGSTVTIVGIGTCTINATQTGNTNYSAATAVPQSFTVGMGVQTISFGPLNNVAITASPVVISATATSGLAVTFTSNTTAVCTTGGTNGSTVTLLTLGTCTIVANQAGNANWTAAAAVNASFTVSAAAQTITFNGIPSITYGVNPIAISATANSGLTVALTSTTPSVCTISGNTVTILTAGNCSIAANQAGNANYGAAPQVTQTFTVSQASQTVAFGTLANVAYPVSPFFPPVSATSGLAVTLVSSTTSVCTVSGLSVAVVGVGTCTLTASQPGNIDYLPASPVTGSFTVSGASQTITFGVLPGVTFGAAPFTLSATASSGLTVTFASATPAVCTVSGNTVTILGAGGCTINANQAGNATYTAAAQVSQSFVVGKGSQTITFGGLSNLTVTASPFPVGATASSGLAVTFSATTSTVCSVAGNIVSILGTGTCTITASQAGNANYAAATTIDQSFTVNAALTITTSTLPTGVLGAAYNQTLTAANGSGALTWTLLAGTLPSSITLSSSGALSGTPVFSGAFPFTAKVTDAAGNTASQAMSLQINAALTITTAAALTNGIQNVAYNQTLAATGGLGADTWSLSSGALPAGITLSSGGVLSGTPTAAGPFSFTVKVVDTNGDSATQPMSLGVALALSITSSGTLPAGITGTFYSTTLTSQGGAQSPKTWSVTSGTLPPGLTLVSSTAVALNSSGILSGNPSVAGTYTFTVTVNDGISPPANLSASITVYSVLSITTAFLPNGTVGTAYGPVTLNSTGGSGTVTWSALGVPSGLTLSSAGVLSGTPTATDNGGNVTLNASDSVSGQKVSAFLPLTIVAATPTLKIAPSNLVIDAGSGSTVSNSFTPSGGTTPYTFTVSSGTLPTGITLSSAGAIGGSTTQAGNSVVTVKLTDAETPPVSVTAQLGLNILGITTTALPAGAATHSYSFDFAATGGALPYAFSATGLPSTFSLSGSGVLNGTAASATTISFKVQVNDSQGASTSANYSLTINPAPVSIPTISLPNGTVGTAYSQTLSAANGTTPYAWTVLSGALPAGLSLATNGTISGTPTAPGAPTFAVQVADAKGGVASASAAILVLPKPLIVTTGSLPAGVVGFSYPPQLFVAGGGISPYSFAVTSGALPPGLSLGPAGLLTGTPTTVGVYPFTVTTTDRILETGSATFSITVNAPASNLVLESGSVTFNVVQGTTVLPSPQGVGVQSSGSSSLSYTVAVNPPAPWLNSIPNGSTPGSLNFALNGQASNLPVGSTETIVTVTCASTACSGKTQNVDVYVNVTAPPPALTVLDTILDFTSNSTPPQAQTQQLGIENSGGGTLNITSIGCAATWCTVGAFPATLAAGAVAQVNVTASPTTLNTGFYLTALNVVTSAGSAWIPITFFVIQTPTMTLAPSGAQFSMQAGGAPGNPNGSFQVDLSGGSATFTAAVLPGSTWLTLNNTGGSATGALAGNIGYTINGAAAGLGVNTYYATIRVRSSGVINSPLDYQVVLNVTPAAQPVTLNPAPAGLIFLTTVGGTAASQTVNVYTNSTASATYTATAATLTGSWLTVSPGSGTTSSAAAGKSTIGINATGLPQGIYVGAVAYAANGASGVGIVYAVLIVLPVGGGAAGSESTAAAGSATNSSQTSAACTPTQLIPVETGLVSNFSIAAGWPTALSVMLVNDCGVAVTGAQVTAAFTNGDPPLTFAPVNGTAGLYAATWTPQQAAAQMSVNETAAATGLPVATTQVTGTVTPNSAPTLTANGTTLPYNSQTGAAVAPGSIIEITGSNLATASASASSAPLPATLSGTTVTIGGITAPLYYVTPTQIEAQVPFSLSPSQQYQLVVNANGALTTPQTVQVSAASPALAVNGDGSVIAQHWDDGSLVTASNPAVAGEYLVFYLVGMGTVSNPVMEGNAAPLSPLSPVTTAPVVTLGGNAVPVLFAGLTPESVGLYQIDIQMPSVTAGGNLLLTVTQGGVVSNTTILPVEF